MIELCSILLYKEVLMEQVKIWKVYRHFKGNYYFVENVAYDSESKERLVVYKPLYNREAWIFAAFSL